MTISLFGANRFYLGLVWLMKTERNGEKGSNYFQFLLEYRMR